MLNFTKQCFDKLLEDYFGGRKSEVIVTRQHITSSGAIIGMTSDLQNFAKVNVIQGRDFYESMADVSFIGKLNDGITYNNGSLIFNSYSAPISNDHIVIYQVNPNRSHDFSELFNSSSINLVSIDYVGYNVGYISPKGCNPDTFVEADLSNVYDYNTDTFRNLTLTEKQNIYFGNHNNITLGANPFNVKKLVLPDSGDDTYTIPANCFAGCTNLVEVVIPNCVTAIGDGAFSGCTNLEYVYIGSKVASIGSKAFNKCINISKFVVDSANTKYIGLSGCLLKKNQSPQDTYTMVFANDNWWKNQYNDVMDDIYTFIYDTNPKNMPSTVSYSDYHNYDSTEFGIQEGQVLYDSQIQGLITGTFKTVNGTTTNHGVFVTSSNINQITISLGTTVNTKFYLPIYYWITAIDADACSGDTRIASVNLSRYKSLSNIGQNAFKGCTNIGSLTLPDNAGHDNYIGSIMKNITISTSAFEGCTGITSLAFKQWYTLADKVFFGCSAVTSITFNSTNGIGYVPNLNSIGTQTFSNMPNLDSITTTNANGNLGNGFVIPNSSNAICYGNGYNDKCIVVGCKNTSLIACGEYAQIIADYAFYGCTQYTPSNNDKNCFTQSSQYYINVIGNYAFYGCTSLDLQTLKVGTINSYAFYGCTSLQSLIIYYGVAGAKAFANSGIKSLNLKQCQVMADDAFEGCVFESVYCDDNSTDYVCWPSLTTVENSLLKKQNTSATLIKSGDGKDIVNTIYANIDITTIKDNAFTGVDMNNGANTTIHIPASVDNIGKNVLNGSKISGDVTGGNTQIYLTLDTKTISLPQIVCNPSNPSKSLLWLLGARYFKNAIVNTASNRANNKHYYDVSVDNTTPSLLINEVIPGGVTTQFLSITWDSTNQKIKAVITHRLLPGYANEDNNSHIEALDNGNEIELTLMEKGQTFNANEQSVYFDNSILQALGNTWQGYSIPNDLLTTSTDAYVGFNNISDSSLADCKWVSRVNSGRIISGENMFKGCTKLTTISADLNNGNADCDYSIFDGVIQKGMFNGCTALTGIVSSVSGKNHPTPIKIHQDAFKGCTSFNDTNILALADVFQDGSFENTGLTDIALHSATNISPKAFIGCNITNAISNGTSGKYFTGFGNCIVDEGNKIVIGSSNFNLNIDLEYNSECKGIGDYAFNKRQYANFRVINSNKTDFTIGKEAFAESNIKEYTEQNSQGTIIHEGAFKNCQYLAIITINNNCTLGKNAFSGCSDLDTVDIPSNIDIPEGCFSKTKIASINIGGNIGNDAFNGCSSLRSVVLSYNSSSTATISPTAFIGCPIGAFRSTLINPTANGYIINDTGIHNNNTQTIVVGVNDADNFINYTHGVKIIGQHAYNGRGLVGEITIPGTVTRIEASAFANNPGITKVYIPPTIEYIGDNAFSGCTNLSQATLPDSCEYIGAGAFKGCSLANGFNCNAVDDDYHSNSASSSNTFNGPSNMQFYGSLDLTNCKAYNKIGEQSFEHTDIEVVKLPKTCVEIEERAFYQCSFLTELHIYSNRITLGNNSFYGCARLRDIYFHNECIIDDTFPGWCHGAGSSASHKIIHIPSSMDNDTFKESDFYRDLHNDYNYLVVVDM